MTCRYPGCSERPDRMAVVTGAVGEIHVRVLTGIVTCAKHQPDVSSIGPNMKQGIARALEENGATGTPTISLDLISLDSAEARQYFAGAPN